MQFFKSKESVGIFYAIFAYLCFALLDTIQKTLIVYYVVFQILLIKYSFTLLISFFESWRKKNYKIYKTYSLKLQILRSLLSALESGCFVLAFRYLSLADAHSIAALTPLIVVIFSVIFLKELVTFKIWIAIFIGFFGVLIIMRPGFSVFDSSAMIPLLGALFLALYQIVTRKVSQYDSNEISLFFTSLVGVITMGILSVFFWEPIDKNFIIFFIGIGIFYSLGLYSQIIALSRARASIIQPFHYTLIFWAIILGYIFYDDLPDVPTLIGGLVITVSGIYTLYIKEQNSY